MNISKLFFLFLSFFIALWLIGDGDWVKMLLIIFYTFWLAAPILIAEDELKESVLGYIVWVVIQVFIYRWALGPPEGIGIPHF